MLRFSDEFMSGCCHLSKCSLLVPLDGASQHLLVLVVAEEAGGLPRGAMIVVVLLPWRTKRGTDVVLCGHESRCSAPCCADEMRRPLSVRPACARRRKRQAKLCRLSVAQSSFVLGVPLQWCSLLNQRKSRRVDARREQAHEHA